MTGSLNDLRNEMAQGIQEGAAILQLSGALHAFREAGLSGDYTGYWDGQPVKAKGIGTMSPQGDGAMVIALAGRQVYSRSLTEAAESIARTITYARKAENPDLVQYFAGTWKTMTKNTERMVFLYPDGTYADRYSSSYSGGETGSWGAAADHHGRGRWTARGTRQQGVFIFTDPYGQPEQYKYHVHVQNGQVYWNEYIIEGELYSRLR